MSKARDKEIKLLARRAEEQSRRPETDHPPAERLAACRAGKLPDSEAEELREHLAACGDCTRAYLELPRFSQEAEKRLRWLRFRERLGWRPSLPPNQIPGVPDRRDHDYGPPDGIERRWTTTHFSRPALASVILGAGMVGCFAGIPVGYVSHHPKPPQAVVAQGIGSETFRSAAPDKPLDLVPSGPGGASTVVWQLPEEWDPKATYRVEMRNAAGATVLVAETRTTAVAAPPDPRSRSADPPRSVAVEIPLKPLAPGDYRLVLSGPPGEDSTREQPVRVPARAKVEL